MGTILNTSKDARKTIEEANKSMEDSVVMTKIEDGIEKPEIVFIDKVSEARDVAKVAIAQIKDVLGQLEKNSDRRPYYEDAKDKMEAFLKDTEWTLDRHWWGKSDI